MKLTSLQIFNKLLNDDKLLELEGQIKFYLGSVDIIVKQKDVVGNIIQEWLQGWLEKNKIDFAPSENTQMPPDFFLDPEDRTVNLLEVKAFNRQASPGFDIADFRMYQEEIIEKPYMLDADYLIFGYDMSDEGIVTIKDLWLKKVKLHYQLPNVCYWTSSNTKQTIIINFLWGMIKSPWPWD